MVTYIKNSIKIVTKSFLLLKLHLFFSNLFGVRVYSHNGTHVEVRRQPVGVVLSYNMWIPVIELRWKGSGAS